MFLHLMEVRSRNLYSVLDRHLLQTLWSEEQTSQWLVEQGSTNPEDRFGPFEVGMLEVEKHWPRPMSRCLLATD